jgi:hypothetical protein
MSKALVCVLLMATVGCHKGDVTRTGTESTPLFVELLRSGPEEDTVSIRISRDGEVSYEQVITESCVSIAQLVEDPLDFDGDGEPEVVVELCEGQNSGDRVLVFGQRDGRWSEWMDVYRCHWKGEYVKVGKRDGIRVLDPATDQMRTYLFGGEPGVYP